MLSGIIPALLTPFDADGQVDVKALSGLIEFVTSHQVDGLYVCGSTGEGVLLSEAERMKVAETAIQQVRGQIPVIVHVGTASTAESERLAEHARKAGAQAIASIPPYYFHYNREGIEKHYQRISAAGQLPFYFYNLPDATNFSLNAPLASSLYKQKIIQGMKYTSNDMLTLRAIMDACGPDFNVLSGPDELLLPFLAMGVQGGIGTTYNCLPSLYKQIFAAWKSGDIAAAQQLQYKADRIILVMAHYGIIPAVKAAMEMIGVSCGDPRAPFTPLSTEQKAAYKEQLQQAGFFD